jgi:hypothetical protein
MTLAKFIRASAVTVGALAVATQVNAADLYSGGGLKDAPVYAPAPMWTGFYFGAHLGADWSGPAFRPGGISGMTASALGGPTRTTRSCLLEEVT